MNIDGKYIPDEELKWRKLNDPSLEDVKELLIIERKRNIPAQEKTNDKRMMFRQLEIDWTLKSLQIEALQDIAYHLHTLTLKED